MAPGATIEPARVDGAPRRRRVSCQLADGDDAIARDGDVGDLAGCAGAVDDGSALNQEVEEHAVGC